MSQGMSEEIAKMHRTQGVELFNFTWTLIEKADRTQTEIDTMIHAAHASRHHWGFVGEPKNFARGEWQISRVYAVLDRVEPAMYHAQRCLAICEENGIGDFDIAYAYEALARATSIAGAERQLNEYVAKARDLGAKIADADDRKHFEEDIATIKLPEGS